MPHLDYKCSKCEKEFDVFYLSQSEVTLTEKKEKCPHCGSTRKKRAVSKGTSHILKGNWFKQGY